MYAAAVFGNRAIAFLNLLLMAYLLDQESFGRYTLLSSNALLLQLIVGSWASASVSKYMPIAQPNRRFESLSTVLLGLFLLAGAETIGLIIYTLSPVYAVPLVQVAVVIGWSLTLIIYEVTLATQNALGLSRSYAAVALSRNSLALILSLSAAVSGLGVIGAAVGQAIGTLLPCIVLPSSRIVWRQALSLSSSLGQLHQQVKFGIGGLVASGLYILFSTTMRNIIAISHGDAAIGRLSLACDLFFVPLALIVNVLFLTKMPLLYTLSAVTGRHAERRVELRTIARGLAALVFPFMIAGALIADRLILVVLPGHVGAEIAPLAPAAAVFGGAFALLYATTMMLLIFDYRRTLFAVAIGVVSTNAAVQVVLPRWITVSELLWIASFIVLGGGLLTSCRLLKVEKSLPTFTFMVKVGTAAGLMSILLLAAHWTPPLIFLLAAPVSLAVYGGVLWQLGAFDRRDIQYFRKSELVPAEIVEQGADFA